MKKMEERKKKIKIKLTLFDMHDFLWPIKSILNWADETVSLSSFSFIKLCYDIKLKTFDAGTWFMDSIPFFLLIFCFWISILRNSHRKNYLFCFLFTNFQVLFAKFIFNFIVKLFFYMDVFFQMKTAQEMRIVTIQILFWFKHFLVSFILSVFFYNSRYQWFNFQ